MNGDTRPGEMKAILEKPGRWSAERDDDMVVPRWQPGGAMGSVEMTLGLLGWSNIGLGAEMGDPVTWGYYSYR